MTDPLLRPFDEADMEAVSGDHPADARLRDYSLGKLDEADSQSIDDHLADCPKCCDSLARLVTADPMVDRLRLAESSVQAFENGRQIGDYRLVRVIGEGGMGIVYEAYQQSLNRRVALKLLPASIAHHPEAVQRFRREARAAANLHHTNIVPVYEIGETDDCQYFAMQLISGRSLAQLYTELRTSDDKRQQEPPTDSREAALDRELRARSIAHMGFQVASALAHAHARGVIHRDIKPSNLLLDDEGVVWVVDFGLAKIEDDDLTRSGQLVGTLRYLAPERFRGLADERSDIYALGVSLYELLVRQRLFESSCHTQSIDRILHHIPLPLRRIDPLIPRDLETIVMKAIAKSPAARYQTAADLADDLLRFYDREAILARRQRLHERVGYVVRREVNPHGTLVASVALLLVVTVAMASQTWRLNRVNQVLVAQVDGWKEAAEQASADATRARAETLDLSQRLADVYLNEAAAAVAQGDPFAALTALCAACLAEDDSERARLHRVRIGVILRYGRSSDDTDATRSRQSLTANQPNDVNDVSRNWLTRAPQTSMLDVVTDRDSTTIRVWDSQLGVALTPPLKPTCPIHQVAYSASGDTVDLIGEDRQTQTHTLDLSPCRLETETLRSIAATFGHPRPTEATEAHDLSFEKLRRLDADAAPGRL